MRRLRLLILAGILASAFSLLTSSQSVAAGTARHDVYSFELATPNTAAAPASGEWISVTGSGTFDTIAGTVNAQGRFTHYNKDGTVHCKGTWTATAFAGFVDFGSNQDGQEGGRLSLVVTHYCQTMGMTMTGMPMTITSNVNAPTGTLEGITVCMFTQPTGGLVDMQRENNQR